MANTRDQVFLETADRLHRDFGAARPRTLQAELGWGLEEIYRRITSLRSAGYQLFGPGLKIDRAAEYEKAHPIDPEKIDAARLSIPKKREPTGARFEGAEEPPKEKKPFQLEQPWEMALWLIKHTTVDSWGDV